MNKFGIAIALVVVLVGLFVIDSVSGNPSPKRRGEEEFEPEPRELERRHPHKHRPAYESGPEEEAHERHPRHQERVKGPAKSPVRGRRQHQPHVVVRRPEGRPAPVRRHSPRRGVPHFTPRPRVSPGVCSCTEACRSGSEGGRGNTETGSGYYPNSRGNTETGPGYYPSSRGNTETGPGYYPVGRGNTEAGQGHPSGRVSYETPENGRGNESGRGFESGRGQSPEVEGETSGRGEESSQSGEQGQEGDNEGARGPGQEAEGEESSQGEESGVEGGRGGVAGGQESNGEAGKRHGSFKGAGVFGGFKKDKEFSAGVRGSDKQNNRNTFQKQKTFVGGEQKAFNAGASTTDVNSVEGVHKRKNVNNDRLVVKETQRGNEDTDAFRGQTGHNEEGHVGASDTKVFGAQAGESGTSEQSSDKEFDAEVQKKDNVGAVGGAGVFSGRF